ncbi:CheR family methyltransferase [Thaumasiovibrio subtropicus]|uniref:CheR family methyltransferase n=1 Tax=Thaumasiovibrio subtropicus TaxID=1891207 RepID=UPI000B360813|nr:protein-glutamate O-methyltransferase CheR [Thaumasiovibrio subtropicus]
MGRVLDAMTSAGVIPEREFEFTDKDFKFVQWFMHKHVGIYLSDKKMPMVYGRIARRLREHKLQRFSDYRPLIEEEGEERVNFINGLTTNKTHFFREMHHFDHVEKVLIPKWIAEKRTKVRIWSAGCSTGEEPYSYMSLLASTPLFDRVPDVKLLATDLDTNVLATAEKGVYSEEQISAIPKPCLKAGFVRGRGEHEGMIKAKSDLQSHMTFRQLNLFSPWPFKGPFDLISCRNVMIYFDKPTQQDLIQRFHQYLASDGHLFIGHSEGIGECADRFENLGHTMFQKR